MVKEIQLKEKILTYDLQYKDVKNINLRIKPDGVIHVSANRRVPQQVIDDFITSKADFILKALAQSVDRMNFPQKQYFSEHEICNVIIALCEKMYPYFKKLGVRYPAIKFRRMASQWGNCHTAKGILTFNINLMYAPMECIEYVVAHEFTHFLVPNHSEKFYEALSKIMPDWKLRRKQLKEIII